MKPLSNIPCMLAINGGSSSIRFAVYEVGASLRSVLSGKIDRIGPGLTTMASSKCRDRSAGEADSSTRPGLTLQIS